MIVMAAIEIYITSKSVTILVFSAVTEYRKSVISLFHITNIKWSQLYLTFVTSIVTVPWIEAIPQSWQIGLYLNSRGVGTSFLNWSNYTIKHIIRKGTVKHTRFQSLGTLGLIATKWEHFKCPKNYKEMYGLEGQCPSNPYISL